jgi:hypothetical protein
MRDCGLRGGPVPDDELVDYSTYFRTREEQAAGGFGVLGGGGRGENGFYHPTKGLEGPLNRHTQKDPTSAPEFRYKGVTLGDVIAAKFSQYHSDEDAWRAACEAIVVAQEAPDVDAARALLTSDPYNASVAQVLGFRVWGFRV